MSEVRNLRIQFYGTQGTTSTFPSEDELLAFLEDRDEAFLRAYAESLKAHCDAEGRFVGALEEYLGGPVSVETLRARWKGLGLPAPRIYDGRTTCVHVQTADGYDLVFDAGSGFRNCSLDLQKRWGERDERHLHLFCSHAHFDHTEGFSQASLICFDPRNHIHVYGPRESLNVFDVYLGIFSRRDDRGPLVTIQTPVSYHQLPATFEGVELRDPSADDGGGQEVFWRIHDQREPVLLGETRVTAFKVHHGGTCLAYKIERGGKKLVFCTDHELRRGEDPDHPLQKESEKAEARLAEHCRGADVLYRDAQYFREEYEGKKSLGPPPARPRLDWGHSCVEDVLEMAERSGVKQTFLGHHDPDRPWPERSRIDDDLAELSKSRRGRVALARGGMVIDI